MSAALAACPVLAEPDAPRPADSTRLGARAAAALKWNYAGTAAKAGCQFLTGVVLARLLGPHPYGEVAVAWLVIGLGNLVADLGMSAALVQRRHVAEEHIRHVFTLQFAAGFVLTGVTWTSGSLLASWYHDPALGRVLAVLSLVFLLQAAGQTATALLKRELRFRALQITQIVSYIIGFCVVGVPLAFRGYGVWSLVMAQLTQAAIGSIAVYCCAPHSLRPKLLRGDSALGFGARVIGTNLVNWTITNLDSALVGRSFGLTTLGIYNRAQVLITYQAVNAVSVLQNVLFSAYSRSQDSPEALRRSYLGSVAAVSVVFAPVFLSIALVPQTVLLALYGARWSGAAPICTPLALAAPFLLVMSLAGPILWASDQVMAELRAQLITCAAAAGIFLLAARISAPAVAWGCLVSTILRCLLVTRATFGGLDITPRDLAANLKGAMVLALLVALATLAADRLSGALAHPILHLAGDMFAAGSCAVAIIALFPRFVLGPALSQAIAGYAADLPVAVRRLLVLAIP